MSIILDPAQPVGYTPREGGPTFLLRPPTVADRIKYQHALSAQGAQYHSNLALMDLAKKALEKLLPGEADAEARGESMAAIDAYCEGLRGAIAERQANKTEATDKAFVDALAFPDVVADLVEALRQGDRALRNALADNAVYWSWAGMEAAKLFLVGWDGLHEPFRRTIAGLTNGTLQQIDPNDLAMIGVRIEQMMQPDEARTKNSDSLPSGPSEGTRSSSAGKTTRRNGHSADATATA